MLPSRLPRRHAPHSVHPRRVAPELQHRAGHPPADLVCWSAMSAPPSTADMPAAGTKVAFGSKPAARVRAPSVWRVPLSCPPIQAAGADLLCLLGKPFSVAAAG